jgi:hypothetical protein
MILGSFLAANAADGLGVDGVRPVREMDATHRLPLELL